MGTQVLELTDNANKYPKESTMSEAKQQHLATLAVHAGQVPDPTTGACAVPIYQTAS
jgi:hypothetical protein